jgi:3-isopropylmalate dehydrogenase
VEEKEQAWQSGGDGYAESNRDKTEYHIAILPGDGIGVEVIAEAEKVLRAVGRRFGHRFLIALGLVGGAAMDTTGDPLPEETLALCKASDAVLLGAAGALADASPLRPELVQEVDLIVVRELTGGIYFGQPRVEGNERALDTMVYTRSEVERIAHVAFQVARERRRKVTSVDKANVLASSRLWRPVVEGVAQDYPDVELEHLLVDAATMHLLKRPRDFDVILSSNMFGDILSDEASVLAGSLGMLPSASLGVGRFGLFEPVHGSAPDIAGRGIANPLAAILSVALLLRHSLEMDTEARCVEAAVAAVLAAGFRTPDIAAPGQSTVTTRQMGDLVVQAVAEREIA